MQGPRPEPEDLLSDRVTQLTIGCLRAGKLMLAASAPPGFCISLEACLCDFFGMTADLYRLCIQGGRSISPLLALSSQRPLRYR